MKKWMQSLFIKDIRRAIDTYQMIPPKSRVLVGVSGGKDSAILFYALSLLSKMGIYDFEVAGLFIDNGLVDESEAFIEFCEKEQLKLYVHREHYAKFLSHESEFAPCYTCSRTRKGIVKRFALENGFSLIAYGHTQDDLVETFMMNIIQHGKIATIAPITEETTTNLKIIRPLMFVPEKAIHASVAQLNIPLMKDMCRFSKNRLRSQAEQLIQEIELTTPDFSDKVIQALQHVDLKRLL